MDFPFRTQVKVYFRDLDAMGHVNNAVYLSYLEIARMDFYEAAFGADGFDRFPFILAEVRLKYLSPAHLKETLDIGIRVGEIGRKSYTFDYLVSDLATDRAVCEGHSVQVMYDYGAKATTEVPAGFRQAVDAFQGRRVEG